MSVGSQQHTLREGWQRAHHVRDACSLQLWEHSVELSELVAASVWVQEVVAHELERGS